MIWGDHADIQLDGVSRPHSDSGTASADILKGGDGDDHIAGEDGNDVIHGDDDNDSLLGGDHSDFIEGGLGTDTIFHTEGSGGDGDIDSIWGYEVGESKQAGDNYFDGEVDLDWEDGIEL